MKRLIISLLNRVKAVKLYFTMLRFSSGCAATIVFSSSSFVSLSLAKTWLAIKLAIATLSYIKTIHILSLILGGGFIFKAWPATFWHIVTDVFKLDLWYFDSGSIDAVDASNHIYCDTPHQDVQHSHLLDDDNLAENKEENKPIYKNPYVIGAAIGLIMIAVALWFYYPYNSLPDDSGSDTDSIISTGTSTVIATDWASVSSVFYNEASPSTSHLYLNTRMFRQALENNDISHYLASLGHYYSTDLVLLNFLREQAEANVLDFTLITDNGGVPLRIFNNVTNNLLFGSFWTPSEIYPTYQSFVTDFFIKYHEYMQRAID